MARKPRSSRPSPTPHPRQDFPSRHGELSEGHWRIALGALFLLTLAWRLLALARLAGSPFMGDLNSDAEVYWAWSGEIRAGAWVGRQAFFLGALYPYFLAILRELSGDSLRAVLSFQCVLGALSVTLLTDAARRLTSAPVALIVGALLGMLSMGIFFDLLVLMESLVFTLTAVLLWLVVAWDWRHRAALGAALVGVCVGLSAQGRATHVLVFIPFALFLFALLDRPRAARAALVALGMIALIALPTTIRHRVLVGEWIPYTYSLGFNAHIGNGPESNGSFLLTTGSVEAEAPIAGSSEGGTGGDGRAYQRRIEGLELTPGQSSRRWLDLALEHVAQEPGLTLRGFIGKLGLLVNHREVPQIENLDVTERVVGRLGPPWLGTFLPLGILGMVGLMLAARRGARERFLAGFLLTLALATAAFFVTDRYRHQLMPAFALLAALTLQRVWDAVRQREPGALLRIALAALVAGALTAIPRVPFDQDHLAWETDASVGAAYLRRGEDALALEALNRAVALDRAGRLRNADWAPAKVVRASVHENLAIALRRRGDWTGALRTYREAARLAPDARSLHLEYGKVAASLRQPEEARAAFKVASVTLQQAAEALLRDAARAQQEGDGTGLEAALRGALTLEPNNELAHIGLIRTLVQAKRFDEAAGELELALRQGLDPGVHAAHQVLVAASRGDSASARAWRARLAPRAQADPRVIATLAMVPSQAGVIP